MASHDTDFERLCDEARAHISELTVMEVNERMRGDDDVLVLDVREDREWAIDRVAGAEHMGRGVLERDLSQRIDNKASQIVLYCGGGYRSALAAESLGKMGYTRVASMAGGIRAWREAGLPLSTG